MTSRSHEKTGLTLHHMGFLLGVSLGNLLMTCATNVVDSVFLLLCTSGRVLSTGILDIDACVYKASVSSGFFRESEIAQR